MKEVSEGKGLKGHVVPAPLPEQWALKDALSPPSLKKGQPGLAGVG